MRKIIAAVGMVLVAAPAAAGPLDGRWGFDAEACAADPQTSDIIPTVIADGRIEYYESACEIVELTPIGGENTSAWRAKLNCGGEGEVWTEDEIFGIDEGGGTKPRQLIEIDMETGGVTVRLACD